MGDGRDAALTRCGTGSDFFDLGGHSIEAMVLTGRISAALGIRITIADLFKAFTPGDMGRRLSLRRPLAACETQQEKGTWVLARQDGGWRLAACQDSPKN
ncbi:MAG TPA: phosphopantetheine-binding protein [Trebonia sp.]